MSNEELRNTENPQNLEVDLWYAEDFDIDSLTEEQVAFVLDIPQQVLIGEQKVRRILPSITPSWPVHVQIAEKYRSIIPQQGVGARIDDDPDKAINLAVNPFFVDQKTSHFSGDKLKDAKRQEYSALKKRIQGGQAHERVHTFQDDHYPTLDVPESVAGYFKLIGNQNVHLFFASLMDGLSTTVEMRASGLRVPWANHKVKGVEDWINAFLSPDLATMPMEEKFKWAFSGEGTYGPGWVYYRTGVKFVEQIIAENPDTSLDQLVRIHPTDLARLIKDPRVEALVEQFDSTTL